MFQTYITWIVWGRFLFWLRGRLCSLHLFTNCKPCVLNVVTKLHDICHICTCGVCLFFLYWRPSMVSLSFFLVYVTKLYYKLGVIYYFNLYSCTLTYLFVFQLRYFSLSWNPLVVIWLLAPFRRNVSAGKAKQGLFVILIDFITEGFESSF